MFNWFRTAQGPALPPGQRVYAVGDVHGRRDLLDTLLSTIEADNASRPPCQVSLIMLGDLIDRGPQSREVVARVREGVGWASTIALMGNHEAVLLDVLDGHIDRLKDWLTFGGRETLLSWGVTEKVLDDGTLAEILAATTSAISPADRGWIARMRSSVRIGDYYFVHAGVRPGVPLDQQIDADRLWIRGDFLDSRRKHGAIIVHGHSINIDVEQRSNRIGLDTGAYVTGRLTALGLDGEEKWLLST